MEYFIVTCKFENECWHIIYHVNDIDDGVVLDEDANVCCFDTIDLLKAYANSHGLNIEADAPAMFDFLYVEQVASRATANIISEAIYDAWNLLGDISNSVNRGKERNPFSKIKDENLDLHEKLFHGCNIFADKSGEDFFVPDWDEDELGRMAEVLSVGMEIFRSHISHNPSN